MSNLFYKVLLVLLIFVYSYFGNFKMSLQNRCLNTEHGISAEALTEMPLCISLPLF